jgi:hypothetical protein
LAMARRMTTQRSRRSARVCGIFCIPGASEWT